MKKFKYIFCFFFVLLCGQIVFPEENILTWEQCIQESLLHHPDMIKAKENVFKARAQKRSAVGYLFPQISGSVRETTSKTEGQEKSTSYAYGVSGTQLVFDGFKTFYEIAEANKRLESAQMRYKEISSDVRLRLRKAFILLLKAYKLIDLTDGIALRRSQSLKLVHVRYDAGREHRGAFLTAVANDAQARFEVEQAERNIDLAIQRLTKELGRTYRRTLAVEGDLSLERGYNEKPELAQLVVENPTMLKVGAEKDASLVSLKSARARFFPDISASGSASKSDSEWQPETYRWSAGVSLSVPLFYGGRNIAAVARAKTVYEEARAQEQSTRDSIILSLDEKWKNLVDAIGKVEVRKKFLDAAEERARIGEAQYATGLLSFDNWIIIEDDVVRVKKTFLDVQAYALIAEAEWRWVQGKTLEEEYVIIGK